ncbi:hypothetical protein [Pseudorhodoplanes sp.]
MKPLAVAREQTGKLPDKFSFVLCQNIESKNWPQLLPKNFIAE